MKSISINKNLNVIQIILIGIFLCHGVVAVFFKDEQIIYWGIATLIYISLFILITTYKLSFKILKRKILKILFSIIMAVISFYITLAIEFIILGIYIAKTS